MGLTAASGASAAMLHAQVAPATRPAGLFWLRRGRLFAVESPWSVRCLRHPYVAPTRRRSAGAYIVYGVSVASPRLLFGSSARTAESSTGSACAC